MNDNVIYLDFIPSLPAPQMVLDAAIKAELGRVIIIGRNQDDSLYVAASSGDVGETLVDIEKAKHYILGLCP